ncbi:3'-5' exonuclease [Roseofilum sp. Guam]|uniref:3'-5' exonuclease n=1 Tax=Roseofilum sp. Guam TaxID=2821502 RepID=UPI00298E83DE|nr:3'-5' exonuclease [Roseofilum sp. Guam]
MPKLDRIVVIDIEATCWRKRSPPGEHHEIIEVGIATVDLTLGKPLEKDSILVKPTLSKVSEFCTQLTTLTQEQVDTGVSFREACDRLQSEYHTHKRVWASYGNYDLTQFEKQCEMLEVPYPFSTRHINIKTLLTVLHGLPKEVGMAQALDLLNLPLIGTHHRGIDDAWNIAHILAHLMAAYRNGNG